MLLSDKLNGIVVIDKPQDYTSFDVVAVMRGIVKQKKVGHTGTLDPLATGVLPILLGSATKTQNLMPDSNKEYVAEFVLGLKTATQDITGEIIKKSTFFVTLDELNNVLKNFNGEINQVPPMYSAIKKDGKRLYDLARQGITVEREARKVKIFKLDLLDFDERNGKASIKVACSKGTYIRTLCNDIGDTLGCGATLTKLRRTKACGFDLENSITLDKARNLASTGGLYEKIIDIDELFKTYEKVNISAAQTVRFNNGGSLMLERTQLKKNISLLDDGQLIRVYGYNNEFLGLAFVCLEERALKIKKRF